jgi:hypothetical protein
MHEKIRVRPDHLIREQGMHAVVMEGRQSTDERGAYGSGSQSSLELVGGFRELQRGVCHATNCDKQRTLWNEIFKRTANLASTSGYSFACIATNDLTAMPSAAYNFYNGRANIENTNSELKDELGLGSIVTK